MLDGRTDDDGCSGDGVADKAYRNGSEELQRRRRIVRGGNDGAGTSAAHSGGNQREAPSGAPQRSRGHVPSESGVPKSAQFSRWCVLTNRLALW